MGVCRDKSINAALDFMSMPYHTRTRKDNPMAADRLESAEALARRIRGAMTQADWPDLIEADRLEVVRRVLIAAAVECRRQAQAQGSAQNPITAVWAAIGCDMAVGRLDPAAVLREISDGD